MRSNLKDLLTIAFVASLTWYISGTVGMLCSLGVLLLIVFVAAW